MSKMMTFGLFGAALLVAAALATAIYAKTTAPEMPISFPAPINVAEKSVAENIGPAPAGVQAVAARSMYLSENILRARLDEAYERGTQAQVQALLQILNERYEHRCCGLPR
jgi:hypothetical protein